jgi:hypothetical protein
MRDDDERYDDDEAASNIAAKVTATLLPGRLSADRGHDPVMQFRRWLGRRERPQGVYSRHGAAN